MKKEKEKSIIQSQKEIALKLPLSSYAKTQKIKSKKDHRASNIDLQENINKSVEN